jgi:Vps4 C terminal oligomerisation domain
MVAVPTCCAAPVQVLLRARPTVALSDLGVFEKFTNEFGEEAS